MIKTLIANVVNLGLWNIILWFIFIMMMHTFVNSGFKAIEKRYEMIHQIYWYDFVWLGIMIYVFIYGIYTYEQ